jgi:hypothetical protein
MRRRLIVIAALLTAAPLTIGLLSSPAWAGTHTGTPTVQSSDTTSTTVQSPGTTSTSTTLSSNPYGCYGQTDYPHESTTDPGYARVHARTQCNVNVYYIYVYTELYRLRWYGWQYLANGSASKYWYCKGVGTYTYDAESYHEVQQGGVTYTAYTGNSNRFTC